MSGKDRNNSEGYSDPTAYAAMRNIARDEDRFRKLRKVILNICDVAGFEVRGRLSLLTRNPERFGGESIGLERLCSMVTEARNCRNIGGWYSFGSCYWKNILRKERENNYDWIF